jgi:hypothetical protein
MVTMTILWLLLVLNGYCSYSNLGGVAPYHKLSVHLVGITDYRKSHGTNEEWPRMS